MLDDLLRLAASKGTLVTAEVARDLTISPALAEQLFGELTRLGYLKFIDPGCGFICGHCAAKEACQSMRGPRFWTLTAKGDKAVRRLSDRDDEVFADLETDSDGEAGF